MVPAKQKKRKGKVLIEMASEHAARRAVATVVGRIDCPLIVQRLQQVSTRVKCAKQQLSTVLRRIPTLWLTTLCLTTVCLTTLCLTTSCLAALSMLRRWVTPPAVYSRTLRNHRHACEPNTISEQPGAKSNGMMLGHTVLDSRPNTTSYPGIASQRAQIADFRTVT